MSEQHYVIKSVNGLSSRASANLVNEANRFRSDIILKYAGEKANLKSIMNVMAMVIRHNEPFSIQTEGPDENEAIQALEALMLSIKLI